MPKLILPRRELLKAAGAALILKGGTACAGPGIRGFSTPTTVDIISPGGAFSPAAVGDGVTDDAPAFRAFNDWAQVQTRPIVLTLGSGAKTFLFNSNDTVGLATLRANSPVYNVKQPIKIVGNGSSSSILKTGASGVLSLGGTLSALKTGNGNFNTSNSWVARVNTASSGATSVTCKTPADTAFFAVNTWALISGIDMQAGGGPPNAYYFEYVYITNVNAGTGVITFSWALQNTYLDTWPVFVPYAPSPLTADCGGPATLYALNPAWNVDATYQDLGIDQRTVSQQTNINGRSMKFVNVKCFGASNQGITPSLNYAAQFINCDLSTYVMEVDKSIHQLTFDGGTVSELDFQSSINNVSVQNGCTLDVLNGTPRSLSITDSTINTFNLGTLGFGRTESCVVISSTINTAFTYTGVADSGSGPAHSLQTDYSMSGAAITIPKTGLQYGCRWAIPGAYCFWTGTGNVNYGPVFKVTSVVDNGTTFTVNTNWTGSGFPSWATAVHVVSSQYLNFAPNVSSGLASVTRLKNSAAAGAFRPQTYNSFTRTAANIGRPGSNDTPPSVTGRVVSITINVSTPYTGVQPTLFYLLGGEFGGSVAILADAGSTATVYNPKIDLKTAGTRVITPSGVTGAAGTDSGLALPSSTVWLDEFLAMICASQNISAEVGVGPNVTVTAITDQGF